MKSPVTKMIVHNPVYHDGTFEEAGQQEGFYACCPASSTMVFSDCGEDFFVHHFKEEGVMI